ncbi:transcription elongation factor TFIIS [Blastocladiella emersonii ATCC 22665]|nr:transcription elongation factor TFIIS [Blastocladiella emersonii ATCC 22665]
METRVLELKKSLQSALGKEKYPLASEIIDQLAELRATRDMLKRTEIGILMNKLKRHADKAVAASAGKALDKWKRDVGVAAKPPAVATGVSARADAGSASPSVSRPTSAGTDSAPNSAPGSPNGTPVQQFKDRSVAIDAVDLPRIGDKTREKAIELFYNALCIETLSSSRSILSTSTNIELALYKKHKQEVSAGYKGDLRQFTSSLKNRDNGGLRESLITGDLDPAAFLEMRAGDLAPGPLRKKLEEARQKSLFLAQAAGNIKATTDQFRCGKCKKRKCSYFQMQTRSADEPMTTFVECLECGNNWKFC